MKYSILFLSFLFSASFFIAAGQTPGASKPSSPTLMKGKGTLSFRLNGKAFRTDSTQTKCWTTNTVPLAMLWGKGEGISISWQIKDFKEKGTYKIDKDSKGNVNFTINGKTYWVKNVDGSNYLNIVVTDIKDMYSLRLLSGSFEGVLEDSEGNKVFITEGKFITKGI